MGSLSLSVLLPLFLYSFCSANTMMERAVFTVVVYLARLYYEMLKNGVSAKANKNNDEFRLTSIEQKKHKKKNSNDK